MTTQTEDLLWIASQQDEVIPRELVIYSINRGKTLYDLFVTDEQKIDFSNKKIVDKFITKRDKFDPELYNKIYELMNKHYINLIKYNDPLFPEGIKNLKEQGLPVMLYHQGAILPFINCIAIVGTRNCSTHGFELAHQLGKTLAELNYIIVTGLARGIDSAAHRGALSVDGKVIGVLPWMYEPYPPEHEKLMEETKKKGCLISEFFFQKSKMDRFKFIQRNAVISGISEILVAVESSYTGGTRWQVELAIKQNKTVIAVEPKESDKSAYDGFEKFIKAGATGASTVDEILEIILKKVKLKSVLLNKELLENYIPYPAE